MVNIVVGLVKGIVCVFVVAVVVVFAVVPVVVVFAVVVAFAAVSVVVVQVVVDVHDVAVLQVVPVLVLGVLRVSWECTFELYLFVTGEKGATQHPVAFSKNSPSNKIVFNMGIHNSKCTNWCETTFKFIRWETCLFYPSCPQVWCLVSLPRKVPPPTIAR